MKLSPKIKLNIKSSIKTPNSEKKQKQKDKIGSKNEIENLCKESKVSRIIQEFENNIKMKVVDPKTDYKKDVKNAFVEMMGKSKTRWGES